MAERYYTKIILFLFLLSCSKVNTGYPFKYHVTEDFFIESSVNLNSIPGHVVLNHLNNGKPRSGTVSHHLLVAPLINSWFKELIRQNKDIKNFFILSPKHTDLGIGNICFSSLDWKISDKKVVKTNKKYIRKILKKFKIKEEQYAFHKEHGISTLIPFINYYYPEAKVIPIVMDEFNKQIGICKKLSEVISEIMIKDESTFLLISVDFSHRADLAKTKKRDLFSKDALNSLNPEKVNEIYSDNNVSLFTLFFTCKDLGLNENHILCDIDSQTYTKKDLPDITSYFFTFQYKDQ